MILKNISGCICSSLTVDDVEEIDLTDDVRKTTLEKIGEYIKTLPQERLEDAKYLLTWFTEMTDDDVENSTLSLEEIGNIVKTTSPENLNYILQGFVDKFYTKEPEISDPCPCCGDCIWTYIVEIP